jgi:hypothetical protein
MKRTFESGSPVSRRVATAFAAWWAGLLTVYLLLISTVTVVEVGVGVVLAGLIAASGVVATRPFGVTGPPGGIRWRRLCWFPLDLVRDLGALARELGRQACSRRRRVGQRDVVRLAEPLQRDATAVRAYAVLMLSSTPGCFVTDVIVNAGEADRLVVHRMTAPARFEAAVER